MDVTKSEVPSFYFVANRQDQERCRAGGEKYSVGPWLGNLPGCGQVSQTSEWVFLERPSKKQGPGVRFPVGVNVFPSGNVGEIELQGDSIPLFLAGTHTRTRSPYPRYPGFPFFFSDLLPFFFPSFLSLPIRVVHSCLHLFH